MLPVLQAIGAGLSAISAIKDLVGSSTSSSSTPATTTVPGTTGANGASALPGSGASGAAAPTSNELHDRFLKLLVAQMKNQDPLNPLDNAQVTTQMAQISTVGGIDKLNGTVQSLANSMTANQAMQSSAIIGRQVYATGSYLTLADGKATGGLDLKQDADRIFVTINDAASGALVRTLQLGPAKIGSSSFQWDGKTDAGSQAANGTYVFQVTAVKGSSTVPVEPLMSGKVGGISLVDGTKLNLEGGREIGMSDIKRIF